MIELSLLSALQILRQDLPDLHILQSKHNIPKFELVVLELKILNIFSLIGRQDPRIPTPITFILFPHYHQNPYRPPS